MIKPEQVPDEVVLAARIAYEKHMSSREAISAAINAWPRIWMDSKFVEPKMLCLPLEDIDG